MSAKADILYLDPDTGGRFFILFNQKRMPTRLHFFYIKGGEIMVSRVLRVQIIVLTLFSGVFALSGTGGVPLGGMGTGYVLYTGGKIRVSSRMPPAGANHALTHPSESEISPSGFHFFADGTAQSPARGSSEDAKCPVQRVEYSAIGDVTFHCDAFGPYWPGSGEEKYQLATSPLAFFDITAENTGAAAAEVAVAMEFGSGGSVDGTQAISLSSEYLMVDCDGASPTFSAGGTGTFSSDGVLSNSDGNLVAAKCTVDAGGKAHFKFVLGWYASYGQEGYYYENFYSNAKEAVEFGMSHFDDTRDGITSFVDRVMASNFPEWYKDRLLNNTYPLIHNSVCAKDGRVAFWEGCYGIIGTIDQGQHAAVFYTFNWPAVQWHELQYWARQQKNDPLGQIHHDFNEGRQNFSPNSTANNRNLKAWDDKTHADYWWFPNTNTWADLNCMFIFKAYELMLATGDRDSLEKNWPALKKAADRLVSRCGSDGIPLQSHSTYDRCNGAGDATGSNCGLTPEYNGGLTIATFRAIAEIAKFCGETSSVTTYTEHANTAQQAFKAKYGNSNIFGVDASVKQPTYGRFPESHIAGYSWANYLCLEPIMDEDFITSTVDRLRNTQKQYSGPQHPARANGEWIFYCVDHYGGAEIAIGRPDDALVVHEHDYDYYYKQVPHMVFWQSLQESANNTHKDSYMTAPTVWHSYFQMCGYMIDNANQRLWIRPRIPTEMGGKITNAILLNPAAHGTLNYDETGDDATKLTQTMTVSFDAPVTVKELVLKNNTGIDAPGVGIVNAGAQVTGHTVTTEEWDIEKNIRVALASPIQIGPEGVKIDVFAGAVDVASIGSAFSKYKLAINSRYLRAGGSIQFTIDRSGPVTVDLLSLNGARIGRVLEKQMDAGFHSVKWTEHHPVASAIVLVRVTSTGGSVIRPIMVR